jgi:hypothetical protein
MICEGAHHMADTNFHSSPVDRPGFLLPAILAVGAVMLLCLYADRPAEPTRCTTDFGLHWWPMPVTGAPTSAYCK